MRASDAASIEAVWQERRERLGGDPIYVVRYTARDGERVHDWFEFSDRARAAAARLVRGNVREARR